MNNINTLTTGTINGLTDLTLDTLTATTLNSDTIDGNIIYYNRIEGNEIIVDTKLTLTNTGVIAVGDKFISDIELTYLDGVSSNIQTQINNINTNNSGLITTVNLHTTQIAALQTSDTSQNTLLSTHTGQISTLQTSDTSQNTLLSTHTGQISTLQTSDTSQNTLLSTHTGQISTLQTSDTSQNTLLSTHTSQITALQNTDTSLNSTLSTHTSQITALQTSDTSQNTLLSTHTSQITALQTSDASQNILLGTHTNQITALQTSDTAQNNAIATIQSVNTSQTTAITSLEGKTVNISSANATSTNMSKPIYLTTNGECFRMIGNHGFISSYDSTLNTRDWYIGTPDSGNKNLNIINEKAGAITINTSSSISLNSNVIWVGSGTASANGRKSNINMLDSTGTAWETQSSAFTETIKQQIGTNTTAIQNITGNGSLTSMSKPLYINSSGEAMRMTGDHNYITGWSSTTNNRDWYLGTDLANTKKLTLRNEKAESIYLQTGSRTGNIITANTNLGQNKVIIQGLGISFKRGGITAGDAEITAGEIGALDPLNSNLYISGNSTNEIHINSGLGATVLNSNMVWIGSGTANANGRKSNINMLNANSVWETQSSAFTEALKAKLVNSFNSYTGKLEFFANSLWWVGQVYNIVNFAASTVYQTTGTSSKKNVGEWIYAFVSGGSALFGSNGAYLLNDNPSLTLVFEMAFTSLTSAVGELTSRVIVENGSGTLLAETFLSGPRYNARQTLNSRIYYHTAPLRHTLALGQKIFVDTYYDILTPNATTIAQVVMKGKFSMLAN